jgi:hypothetical protein
VGTDRSDPEELKRRRDDQGFPGDWGTLLWFVALYLGIAFLVLVNKGFSGFFFLIALSGWATWLGESHGTAGRDQLSAQASSPNAGPSEPR